MTTKFYINQKTKRIIKSPGKTFSKLKHKNLLKKEPCLYNLKSAKKCFYKLSKLYPKIVYPSSNFVNIPKTYKVNTIKGLRAFIISNNNIIAFINKHGFIYRLRYPINKNIIGNKSIPTVIDYNNTLPNFIQTLPKINKDMQKKVYYQIKNVKPNKNVYILFNHIQKDFIPINKRMDVNEHYKILNVFNDNLIKKTPKIYEIPDYPKIIPFTKKPTISSIKPLSIPSITELSTPTSTTPSTLSSIKPSVTELSTTPSTLPSITPSITELSTTPSITPSTLPSVTPSISELSTTPSTLSSIKPSVTPSATTSTITSFSPELSSTPLSVPPKDDFKLSFVGDKLMKISEISSNTISNIKIIKDENGNIIGYTE